MTVYGVGVYVEGKYKSSIKRKMTREYSVWTNMLSRCYCGKTQQRHPTYHGCEVSENFKDFQYFAEWCNQQNGFYEDGWELDKDLVGNGKLYSEEYCVFIPRIINSALAVKMLNRKGKGVYFNRVNRTYDVNTKEFGKYRRVGCFSSKKQAYLAYVDSKKQYLKVLCDKYKGKLSGKAISALLDFELDETFIQQHVDEEYQLKEGQCWVDGAEGKYFVSSDGKVFSVRRGKSFELNRGRVRNGLVTIRYNDGVVEGKYVHRLVAKYFVPNPDNKSDVRFIDGDRNNTSACNLIWLTKSENMLAK